MSRSTDTSNNSSSSAKINVKVAVRIRPLSDAEKQDQATTVVKFDEKKGQVICKSKTFSAFDKVFGQYSTQEQIYKDMVSPQVKRVLAGYNTTLFAYGQTGTGKTFTMEGGRGEGVRSYRDDPSTGIIPRAVENIFEELEKSNTEEYSVRISYLELYNEELYDLLAPNVEDRERLRIFDDPSKKGMVVISGAEETPVKSRDEVYALLRRGAERRMTAATLMNMNSSRSHSIFIVNVVVRENTENGEELVKQGKMNLVDLAGSEHIGRSGAEGKRAKEAGNINQSLLTLGRVITALTNSAPHVPYRESKLTRLLQDSLGGSTITSIIATLSPASTNYEETLSTLEYASRAKNIRNHPECNQKLSRKAILKEFNDEIEKLRRDLRMAREKNGIYISEESYQGMEAEIASKTERLQELEDKFDNAVKKLQMFIEDMQFMDEQYNLLYHRNVRLENKLGQRVDELQIVKKDLAETEIRLNAFEKSIKKLHKVASQLFQQAKDLRETSVHQQSELDAWWSKEERMKLVLANNSNLVESILEQLNGHDASLRAQMTDFSEELEELIVLSGLDRDGTLTATESMVLTLKKGNEEFTQKLIEELKKLKENMVQQQESFNTHLATYSQVFASVMENTATTMENMQQDIESQAESLLQNVKTIEEAQTHIQKEMAELIGDRKESIQTETTRCEQFSTQMSDMINKMKNDFDSLIKEYTIEHTNAMEKEASVLETMETVLVQHDDQLTETASNIRESVTETQNITAAARSNIGTQISYQNTHKADLEKAIKVTLETSRIEEENIISTINNDTEEHMEYLLKKNKELLSRVEERTKHMREKSEKQTAVLKDFVSSETCTFDSVRGEMDKLKKGYAKVEITGGTPMKEKRQLIEYEDIPRVQKVEKLLKESGLGKEARKSIYNTRESLLEVQNMILSPESMKTRKPSNKMEDIQEDTTDSENRIQSFESSM